MGGADYINILSVIDAFPVRPPAILPQIQLPLNIIMHIFNPIALTKVKIVCNFGLSECNRVDMLIYGQTFRKSSVYEGH